MPLPSCFVRGEGGAGLSNIIGGDLESLGLEFAQKTQIYFDKSSNLQLLNELKT